MMMLMMTMKKKNLPREEKRSSRSRSRRRADERFQKNIFDKILTKGFKQIFLTSFWRKVAKNIFDIILTKGLEKRWQNSDAKWRKTQDFSPKLSLEATVFPQDCPQKDLWQQFLKKWENYPDCASSKLPWQFCHHFFLKEYF